MATQTAILLEMLGPDAYAEQVAEEAFVDAMVAAPAAQQPAPERRRVTALGR